MKKALLYTFGLSVVLMTGVSCKKSCDIPEEDTYSGPIITEVNEQNVVIYASKGGYLKSFPNGLIVSNGSDPGVQELFEVSFDGGITRQAIDYSQYALIGYPLNVKCDAYVDRDLAPNFVTGAAVYTMTIDECDDCDQIRSLENYILVPDSVANYNVLFNVVQ